MNYYTDEKIEDMQFYARVEARSNGIAYSRVDGPELFNGKEFIKDFDRASRK